MQMPHDADWGRLTAPSKPEQALVYAILARAVLDLFGSVRGFGGAPGEADTIQRDALAFLTAKTGPWAESRHALCSLAGFDANVFADRVIAMLDGTLDVAFLSNDSRRDPEHIEQVRASWARRKAAKPNPRARTTTPASPPVKLPRIVERADPKAGLRRRVYSYLDVPRKQVELLDLMPNLPLSRLIATLNDGLARGELTRDKHRKYHLATSTLG